MAYLAVFQLFQYFPTKVSKTIQSGLFWLFSNFSNIFLLKLSKLIPNGQFWPFFLVKKKKISFNCLCFTCLILINLAIECSLIFIHVSLKEHNLVHQDRINSLPSNGLQMWLLPFSEKHNITIAIKNRTHSAIYEC